MKVFIVYNDDQGWVEYVGSTLENARKYFVEEAVESYVEGNGSDEQDFDPLNPETNENYEELLDLLEWRIIEFPVDSI